MYCFLKDFQILIAGLLGFAGVIFTLWQNARAARQQVEDKRDHQRQMLRAALLEELRINRDTLKENAGRLRERPADVIVPTDLMNDAYRSFVSEIGMLSHDEVSKVMKAYLTLQTYNAKLFLIREPGETSPRHVVVRDNDRESLAGTMEGVIEPIEFAIDSLHGRTGVDHRR